MQVAITNFKAHCMEYVRDLGTMDQPIEITKRGDVVAVLSYPKKEKKKNPLFGALKGTITHMAEDFDAPLGDTEWEASGDDVLA